MSQLVGDFATANGANVSVRSPFAPGTAAGVVAPTEPLVREHRLGPVGSDRLQYGSVCGLGDPAALIKKSYK